MLQNTSTIVAKITSDTQSKGIGIGVTLAFNTIGIRAQNLFYDTVDALLGTGLADEQPAVVKASIEDSSVDAAGEVHLSAISDVRIDANIGNSVSSTTLALKEDAVTVSGSGVIALNKISTEVKAYIDGAPLVLAGDGDIRIDARDISDIVALVNAPATAIAVSAKKGTAVAIALSVARNEIRNNMAAYIRDAEDVTAVNGTVWISADERAVIDATSTATAIAVAASLKGSLAASGGGAIAVNLIQGQANAFIEDSSIIATGSVAGQGEVNLEAYHESGITALVKATAASVAVSGGTTPAVAIGFSLARNLIGWSEYGGATPIEVRAYIEDTNPADANLTNVLADRRVRLKADASSTIDATVAATTVAVAASTKGGFAAAAPGCGARTRWPAWSRPASTAPSSSRSTAATWKSRPPMRRASPPTPKPSR